MQCNLIGCCDKIITIVHNHEQNRIAGTKFSFEKSIVKKLRDQSIVNALRTENSRIRSNTTMRILSHKSRISGEQVNIQIHGDIKLFVGC